MLPRARDDAAPAHQRRAARALRRTASRSSSRASSCRSTRRTSGSIETIRGVDALATVERGVARLRRLAPAVPVTARATLHRLNFRELPRLIDHAQGDGARRHLVPAGGRVLARRSAARARRRPRTSAPSSRSTATRSRVRRYRRADDRASTRDDFASGFIAESPDKLRRLPQLLRGARRRRSRFRACRCNAPWVSVGDRSRRRRAALLLPRRRRQRPRHAARGDRRRATCRAFRQSLDVGANPVCVRCVCSLKTSWRSAPWRQ